MNRRTSSTAGGTAKTPGNLAYEVFVSDPIPFADVEKAPNGDPRMYQPISSTLIFGATDAVLVDPPMTIAQTERVALWIERSGKRLTHIVITHGHGDHWFGTAPLLRRFPGVLAFASPGTIEVMRYHGSPEVREQAWDKYFPAQIPDSPVLATTPPGNSFDLEGSELRIIEVGHTDTDKTTVLHVPSIGLVVAGDVVYNGVHQYLAETANGGFREWIKGLDIVAALRPSHVVAGHKNKGLPDDPKAIDETRRYLEDAERLVSQSHTAREFYDAMLALYPDRRNPSALWFWGAKALFPKVPLPGVPDEVFQTRTTQMRRVHVERFRLTSRKPFRDVLAALHEAVGHPDMDAFRKSVGATRTLSELERVIHSALGRSGFMEFIRFDHGDIVHKGEKGEMPGIVRLVVGNPLIMRQMVQHVPDAGSYAPVTILIDERPDGVHLSYDRMARLLEPYGNAAALQVARDLDAKVEALLASAAG